MLAEDLDLGVHPTFMVLASDLVCIPPSHR